ncbi:MAG: Zn-dependent M28 family amino/carboxypeptidase [Verrucomicrobiales bacterium]|jgi:Zn-dependent M28 family amino/carboxypeptidase
MILPEVLARPLSSSQFPIMRHLFLLTLFLAPCAAFVRAEVVEPGVAAAAELGLNATESTEPEITSGDLRQYAIQLASEDFEGRGTGDPGEVKATAFLAAFFDGLGLKPEGADDSFFQPFPIDVGLELVGENQLHWTQGDPDSGELHEEKIGEGFLPLSIAANAEIDAAEAVFVGFGIETEGYNSFEGLDVDGKWMVVLRGVPKQLTKQLRQLGTLVAKAKVAKERGAAGIMFIKAENPEVSAVLIPPSVNVGAKERLVPAMNLSDAVAQQLLDEDKLLELFEAYHSGERVVGYPLGSRISAKVSLEPKKASGRNVIGRLVVGAEPSAEAVMIGGHVDHLGYGNRGGSLAQGEDAKQIHFGADDNASGVAAIMELAQHFAALKQAGNLELERDLIFVGWSGEEMGLVGSKYFIKEAMEESGAETIYPAISAYVNLDMVGRLQDRPLLLQGTGSSSEWDAILDELAGEHDLEIKRSPSPFLPTDATPIYSAGVPILAAFTGLHPDYHTPTDTVDKVDFEGIQKIADYLADLIESVAKRPESLVYTEFVRPDMRPKVSLGISFDPKADEAEVLKIAKVVEGSPAEQAGVEVGDVIEQLDGKPAANRDALFRVLGELKAGVEYPLEVQRGEKAVKLTIKPVARGNPRSGE